MATALSVFLGHGAEAIAIALIVLFAVLLGFAQEYRSERALEALRQMAAPTATALRDGEEVVIPARDIVIGDVILLRSGDKVPADARLIEAVNLQIEEAALTGESLPVEKQTEALGDGEWPLAERKNMVYAGTAITYGRGKGVVVATGMATEFGKTAAMLESVATAKTPLQENLDKVGSALARAALIIVGIIVGSGSVPRPAVHGDVDLRHCAGGGGCAGSAAGSRNDLPGSGRAADGQAQRAGAPPARGGNFGQYLRHLLRQNRNPHQRRDDGRASFTLPGKCLKSAAPVLSPTGSSRAPAPWSSLQSRCKLFLRAAALTSDARLARSNGRVADQRRPDGRRAGRPGRQGRLEKDRSRRRSFRVCMKFRSAPKPSA